MMEFSKNKPNVPQVTLSLADPTGGSPAVDWALVFACLFLTGIGLVMVYSASCAIAARDYNNPYFFVTRQAGFAAMGIVAMVVARFFPYKYFQQYWYVLFIAVLALLAATIATPFGHSAGGARRWLDFGLLRFQPSEFARFATALFLARWLTAQERHLRSFIRGMLPCLAVIALPVILIALEPDFGAVVILLAMTWGLLFAGGMSIKNLVIPVAPLVPALWFFLITARYRLERIVSFLDPWAHADAQGYQIIHSFFALGSGGAWGVGVGQGMQKLFYLPEPHTDFIFSVLGEELGFAGVGLTILAFAILIYRLAAVAYKTRDRFGSLLAFAIALSVSLQVIINLAVVMGLLPTKGLSLPFISYGGTSLVFHLALIGVVANINASECIRKTTRTSCP